MGSIIVLAILIPIGILVTVLLIYSRTTDIKNGQHQLLAKIQKLEKDIESLKEPQIAQEVNQKKTWDLPPKPLSETIPKPVRVPEPQPQEEEKPKHPETALPKVVPKPIEPTPVFVEKTSVPAVPKPAANRDLEKFIGENLANKIGIAVLVLGIGFFVKYAIDKDWVNETGRVLIGLISGGILLGMGHRMRIKFRSFSSVLIGGGLAVFYFTIAFAFQEYKLIGQTSSFAAMVFVTLLAVLLSIRYDRIELAIIALIGGYLTPFLLSTGQDNYTALFTYIAILNTGMMTLAYYKRWVTINFIAVFATLFISAIWLINRKYFNQEPVPVHPVIWFFSLFFLQFVVMNIIHQVFKHKSFKAFDLTLLLAVNFLFMFGGLEILKNYKNGELQGLFTGLIGIFNLGLFFYFRSRTDIDRNFTLLLMGLGISFITIAIPVQLKGDYVILFWSAECIVLWVLFQRSRFEILKYFSSFLFILTLVRLTLDWDLAYFSDVPSNRIVFNTGGIATLVVTLTLLILMRFHKREADSYFAHQLTNDFIQKLLAVVLVLVLWTGGVLKIAYQLKMDARNGELAPLYIPLYSFLIFLALIIIYPKKPQFAFTRILIVLFGLLIYLIFIEDNLEITRYVLRASSGYIHLITHALAALILLYLIVEAIIFFQNQKKPWSRFNKTSTLGGVLSIIFILSAEFYQIMHWLHFRPGEDFGYWDNLYQKAGLSILWAICSFVLMWLGMRYSKRLLRIISLSLFTITLAKLFLVDIRNIPPGGKIAAFISLGILLLIISFMYQKLKKVVLEKK